MPGLRVAVGATRVGQRYNPGPVRTRQAWDAQTCSGAELGTRGYRGSPELDETPSSSPRLVTCQPPARRQVLRTLCFWSSVGGRRPKHPPAIQGHRPVCSRRGGPCTPRLQRSPRSRTGRHCCACHKPGREATSSQLAPGAKRASSCLPPDGTEKGSRRGSPCIHASP